jgi:hypothetical protein
VEAVHHVTAWEGHSSLMGESVGLLSETAYQSALEQCCWEL